MTISATSAICIFVTPTILDQRYGSGLEDQVSGLRHTGKEYTDPNAWRDNAKGAVRLVPTSHRPPPITPSPGRRAMEVQFKSKVNREE